MLINESEPETWLPELKAVLIALGAALHGRQPTSQIIAEIGSGLSELIPGHVTTLRYRSRAENDARFQHNASIDIEIVGQRINAKWGIAKGTVCRMINSVCPNSPIRLS